jgi:hypothetical protein
VNLGLHDPGQFPHVLENRFQVGAVIGLGIA